jgi:hypothetical protein
MARAMRLLPVLGLLALALAATLPASAAPEATNPATGLPDPRDLGQLEARLSPMRGRLQGVLQRANEDERISIVQRYAALQPVELEDKNHEPKAEDLLKIMSDRTAAFELREAAMKALTAGFPKTFDLDLLVKKGSKRPRDDLSFKHVWPMLDDDKDTAAGRKLANDYLIEMHGRQTHEDILGYNPRTTSTWKPAKNAWRRILR